jgi:hypothetical protein
MSFVIGAAATDRAETLDTTFWSTSYAVISKASPCVVGPGSIGHITNIDIYLTEATAGLRCGIAYASGARWKIRSIGAAVAGTVGPGLVNISGLDLLAIDGDMIVVYATHLNIDMGDTGSGYVKFDLAGNPFTKTNPMEYLHSGTAVASKTLSVYAYGYIETPQLVTGQYEKFERNEFNDDSSDDFSNTNLVCQTFTVGTIHKLQRVEVKLIATGACGAVTMSIYATDTTGKPTGTALAWSINSRVPAITFDAEWVRFNLLENSVHATPPITLEPKTYAIVLSAVAAGAWARYEATGSYTSGYLWESTDSGATWVKQENPDLLFVEYGTIIQTVGSYTVQLYPKAKGTNTQLVPSINFQPATLFDADIDNYSCVDDLANSPDEGSTAVMFAIGSLYGGYTLEQDWNNFLSGESEHRAGHLKTTDDASYNLWQSGVNGLTSPGNSLFTKQLEVGDILRSPTQNEWYGNYKPRLSRILSIEDDQNLTLSEDPKIKFDGNDAPDATTAWYNTPCSKATADNPPDPRAPVGQGNLPFNYMNGTWSWEHDDHVVTGSGGNAEDELIYPAVVFHASTIKDQRPQTWGARSVRLVTSDNEFETWEECTWDSRTDEVNKTNYLSYTYKDAYGDEATETQFCKPTKRDSYIIKATLNKNPILGVQVVFRVCVALKQNATWDSVTGTAQPFLKLDGIDSLGTEVTIPSVLPMGAFNKPIWFTARQTISRPGGGIFTRDDINNMEVGIILGNLGGKTVVPRDMGKDPINAPAVVACTQLYVDVIMSRSGPQGQNYYITQNGQRVFDNGFDEWCLPVFDFDMNQSTHWIYRSLKSDFIAKPISVLRKITSKILRRHRTSRSLIRGKTSKEL